MVGVGLVDKNDRRLVVFLFLNLGEKRGVNTIKMCMWRGVTYLEWPEGGCSLF